MRFNVLHAVCLMACVLYASGLGTMWVNNIIGNDDFQKVQIEEVIFDDNLILMDFGFGLESPGGKTEGTYIEDTNVLAGSMSIPVNLLVEKIGTVRGLLNFNGGLRADDGDGGVSFSVDNDIGTTYVKGVTNPNGGINVQNGAFFVEDDTGRTTIRDALLRPNGPTIVGANLFTVSEVDGAVHTLGSFTVEKDIILGTDDGNDREVTRQATGPSNPGQTFLKGQDASEQGGNLVFQPGFATGEDDVIAPGAIVLGAPGSDDFPLTGDLLTITRGDVDVDAGVTTYRGQDSFQDGGSIVFTAGSTGVAGENGANVEIVPGIAPVDNPLSTGDMGDIVLGFGNYDAVVRRPGLSTTQGGSNTYFVGQDVSSFGTAPGDVYLRAGNPGGSSPAGNVFLQPGQGSPSGDILLGRAEPDDINVFRQTPTGAFISGSTTFRGQSSGRSHGGSIHFEAGDASTQVALFPFNGGNLVLLPGSDSPGVLSPVGDIIVGQVDENLTYVRPSRSTARGTSTTLVGTDTSVTNDAGDVELHTGWGELKSGDLSILGSDGYGLSQRAGDIRIEIEPTSTNAASLRLWAGFSNGTKGSTVEIEAGSGGSGGNLIITGGSGVDAEVVVQNGRLVLEATDLVQSQLNGAQFWLSDLPTPDDGAPLTTTNGTTVFRLPQVSGLNDVGIFRSFDQGVEVDLFTLGTPGFRTAGQNRFLRAGNELQFNLLEPQLDRFKVISTGDADTVNTGGIPRAVVTSTLGPLTPASSVCEIFVNYNRLLCAIYQIGLVDVPTGGGALDPCTFDYTTTCTP